MTAANSLQLPLNPLHFFSASPSLPSTQESPFVEEQDESENATQSLVPQQMTLTLLAGPSMQERTLTSTSRRTVPPSRVKVLFDTLVNHQAEQDSSLNVSISSRSRPRLIYVRDFPTLAPSASSWYPHLLSAVRQRRRGPISRPSSPISNPTTIIFGMTPAIAPHTSTSPPSHVGSLLNMIPGRNPSPFQAQPHPRHNKSESEWGEDEASEKAREKRLRGRLSKWEKGDAELLDEYARLAINSEFDNEPDAKPGFIFIGPGGPSNAPPSFSSLFSGQSKAPGSAHKSFFFRTSMLVPQTRSPSTERSMRIARRREINELTMRMGIGAVGGCVQAEPASEVLPPTADTVDPPSSDQVDSMWASWGSSLESWANVCKIADRALGNVMSSCEKLDKSSLEPTHIPWSIVQNSWLAHKTIGDRRKLWLKEVVPGTSADEEDETNQAQVETDEVIRRVKNDGDLDVHEQRLLPCIVDPGMLSSY